MHVLLYYQLSLADVDMRDSYILGENDWTFLGALAN